jgi:hypothetical protein
MDKELATLLMFVAVVAYMAWEKWVDRNKKD